MAVAKPDTPAPMIAMLFTDTKSLREVPTPPPVFSAIRLVGQCAYMLVREPSSFDVAERMQTLLSDSSYNTLNTPTEVAFRRSKPIEIRQSSEADVHRLTLLKKLSYLGHPTRSTPSLSIEGLEEAHLAAKAPRIEHSTANETENRTHAAGLSRSSRRLLPPGQNRVRNGVS